MILATLLLALAQTKDGPPAAAYGAMPPPPTASPLPGAAPGTSAKAAQVMPTTLPPRAAKPAAADRRTCRTYETTGSIMPGRRECHTGREWAAIDARNGEGVAAMRDRGNASGSARPY